MRNDRLVILGNGGAAVFAAEAARMAGHHGEIHLISDTAGPAFNPMLSPYYFKGKLRWEGCFPFADDFYRRHDLRCHFGSAVASLDAVNRHVTLANGSRFPYDRCLIATGAVPVVPPIPGLRDSPRALPLRTASSARRLEEALDTARRAVILGASFVGIKMAEILVRRGIEVVLLDVVDQLLPRGTHPTVAAILRGYLEDHGVDVRLGCTLEGMEGAGEGVVCHFSGDAIAAADIVLVCTGVRPNLGFVDRGQVSIEAAVLTDARMRASVENLYAAGDASQGMNLVTGTYDWLGTWGGACYQGRTAGRNMAGGETVFPGALPENISPLFDWSYAQLGDLRMREVDTRHIACGDPKRGGYALLAFQNDRLTGANLINCTRHAGTLRRAILQKRRCGRVSDQKGGPLTEAAAEAILNDCLEEMRPFG